MGWKCSDSSSHQVLYSVLYSVGLVCDLLRFGYPSGGMMKRGGLGRSLLLGGGFDLIDGACLGRVKLPTG